MSSQSQIDANRANAQHSTGPKTAEGKAAVSQNNLHHGLTGRFQVLHWENQNDYDELLQALHAEYEPRTGFEWMLLGRIAQHFWLSLRAIELQRTCFEPGADNAEKHMNLYLRYQAAHDRAFHKYSDELRKLRNHRRKEEIGFESQKHVAAAETRRQSAETRQLAAENRKQELHQFAVLLAGAKLEHQKVLTSVVQDPSLAAKTAHREVLKAQKAA